MTNVRSGRTVVVEFREYTVPPHPHYNRRPIRNGQEVPLGSVAEGEKIEVSVEPYKPSFTTNLIGCRHQETLRVRVRKYFARNEGKEFRLDKLASVFKVTQRTMKEQVSIIEGVVSRRKKIRGRKNTVVVYRYEELK